MLRFIKNNKYLLLLILIAVLTHWQWFDLNSLLFYGDWRNWPDENISRFIHGGYGSYVDDIDFGSQNIQIYLNFLFFIWGIIKSYALAAKLTLFIPIAVLSVVSPYLLVKELIKNEKAAFVSALFFSFSTTLLKLELAHLFIALGFVLVPLIVLFFKRLLENFNGKNAILFSLMYSVGIYSELRIAYITSFILLLYFALFFDKNIFWKNKKNFFLIFLLIVFLNAFWLLPTIFGDKTAISNITNRGLFGNQFFNMFYSLANFHYSWDGLWFNPFSIRPVPLRFWITPLFAFGIFLYFKKIKNKIDQKNILFFGILSIIGILLTKQSEEPFPNLYLWLYENFPGFNLFREASKFFILILIGYLGLFAYALKYLIIENKRIDAGFKKLFLIAFGVFFIWNAKPLITGEIGWLFVDRREPQEYKILNSFISKQPDYFRTLWAVRDSQWSYYNWDKPKISLASVKDKEYFNFYKDHAGEKLYANFIFEPFKENYGNYLADISGIKYFVIPMPNEEDDVFQYYGSSYEDYAEQVKNIDFLKSLALTGLDKIKLYENENYKPHIFSIDKIYSFDNLANLDKKYDFIGNELKKDFNFVVDNNAISSEAITRMNSLFEGVGPSAINKSVLRVEARPANPNNDNNIYINSENDGVCVLYAKNKIIFYKKPNGDLMLNSQKAANLAEKERVLKTVGANGGKNYYIQVGDEFFSLEENRELNLGNNDRNRSVKIFYADRNLVSNPSFESGLWREKVGDCHDYDKSPILAMNLNKEEKSDGGQSLQLEAARHIACTFTSQTVKGGSDYLLSFDYQSPNAKQASYYIGFNGETKTAISGDIPIKDREWKTFSRIIAAPSGATSVSLYVYAKPTDGKENITNRYDNFRFSELKELEETRLSKAEGFKKIPLNFKDGENVFEYEDKNYDLKNLVSNPSFESGLWREKVGDCHDYDKSPILAMNLNKEEKSDGGQSLQLEAARHIACTFTSQTVKGGSDYLLSFDYQSPNAKQASYYIGFNGETKTAISGDIPIKDREWKTFSKIIAAPSGATSASLYVYAKPTDGKENITNRYDNFRFIEIPGLADAYYTVSEPKLELKNPASVNFELINPTKKLVHIKGAATPFYLAMSESYNSRWRLQLANNKARGIFNSWWPFSKPDEAADAYHYKLNDFLNAWYVNPAELCEKNNSACQRNLDNSYDLEMVIEFWPQRWFYFGSIISGITLMGCAGYLIYRRRKEALES